MTKYLQLANDFKLPLEAVTETFGILAVRGVGKTHTAAVMAEEMLLRKLPIVVIDPIGVWWGLRSAANGKDPGLSVIIFGGEHSDVPLEVGAGELIANLIVKERISAVLDLSLLRKNEQVRFMTDFAETLYRKNREALHVFVDEADAYANQRPQKGAERLLGAMEDLVRRGRARGIGLTLITQRAAVLNKNVLTQISVLVAMRTVSPNDRAAIELWTDAHGTKEQAESLRQSLPTMPIGTAWFWSPGWLDIFQKVHIRKRQTFDSSATPKVGKDKRHAPQTLAKVNLEQIKEQIQATVERAKAEDPKFLKAEISRLNAELKKKAGQSPDPAQTKQAIDKAIGRVKRDYAGRIKKISDVCAAELKNYQSELSYEEIPEASEFRSGLEKVVDRVNQSTFNLAPSGRRTTSPEGGKDLGRCERAILTVLKTFRPGRNKSQLGILSGYSPKSSSFANALGKLRSLEYIGSGANGDVAITVIGADIIGDVDPLPFGKDLFSYWLSKLSKCEREILVALHDAYPRNLGKQEVANLTESGYSSTSSSFANALGKLRTLELIEGTGNIKISECLI